MVAPSQLSDARVQARARFRGLDPDETGFNARGVEVALRRALQREEPDGVILSGLGELAARCHVEVFEIITRALRWRASGRTVEAWVRQVRNAQRPQLTSATLWTEAARAQLVESGDMSWATLRTVTSLLERPWEAGSRRYGEAFVSKLGLRLAPRALFRQGPAPGPLLSAAVDMLWRRQSRERTIDALLRAPAPALRLLGAAALGNEELPGCEEIPIADRCGRLRAAGWHPNDALWLAALPVKATSYGWFSATHRLEALENEWLRIEADPQSCMHGPSYAPLRLAQLQEEISTAAAAIAASEARLSAQASAIAECWPAADLTPGDFDRLDEVFVGRGEVRERVALCLSPGPWRNALLNRTIDSFGKLIGLDDTAKAFDTYFFRDAAEVFSAASVAARSMLLRYEQDATGPGRRTGQRIESLISAGERLLAQPFLAARRPGTYQAALARLACALVFAFEVVHHAPPERQTEVAKLRDLALQHTATLLSAWRDDELASPYLEPLALTAVLRMAADPSIDVRKAWRDNPRLAPFARACAMWTDPAAVKADLPRADALFAAAAQPALVLAPWRCGYARALMLLDTALASCRTDPVLLARVNSLWMAAAAKYARHGVDLSLGDKLQAAAAGNAAARSALRAHPRLRGTLAAQMD